MWDPQAQRVIHMNFYAGVVASDILEERVMHFLNFCFKKVFHFFRFFTLSENIVAIKNKCESLSKMVLIKNVMDNNF